jgi:hypothetical protein
MRDRWFSKTTYNGVGRMIGYGVAPLSVASLGLPVYLQLPEKTRGILAAGFLVLAVTAVFCNVYLICHRKMRGHGASMFPLIVSATGISALFLRFSHLGYRLAPVVILILAFDFFGQGLLAERICSFLTTSEASEPDR